MADLSMMTEPSDTDSSGTQPGAVRRSRGLPRGRAVVGALLVTAAAVAVFAAYLDATGEPRTSYLVAAERLEPGTRFAERDQLVAAVTSAPLDLQPELAARAIPIEELDALVGWQVVAPLERGELLTRSAVVAEPEHGGAQAMSFALPRSAAVGGALRAGERIDVLATSGSGEQATTGYIVRGVPLLHVAAADAGALGGGGEVSLTVAITELDDVLALGHAINTASVFVTRSTADAEGAAAPAPHRGSGGGPDQGDVDEADAEADGSGDDGNG
jgi:Flp pilus assembly protein CpaB